MYFDITFLQAIVYTFLDIFPFTLLVGLPVVFVCFVLYLFISPIISVNKK